MSPLTTVKFIMSFLCHFQIALTINFSIQYYAVLKYNLIIDANCFSLGIYILDTECNKHSNRLPWLQHTSFLLLGIRETFVVVYKGKP